MTRRHVAGIGLWIVTACGAAAGQERNQDPASAPTPAVTTMVRTHTAGGLPAWQPTPSSPRVRETHTAVFRRGIDGRLEQIEHVQQREQEVRPGVLMRESMVSVRDVNGRFEPTEKRIRETRTLGPFESVEEETIRRRDLNGAWTVTERNVTHRFEGNGLVRSVIDMFDQTSLIRRVERTITTTADGGRQTERQVFDRDVNGRLVLAIKDIEKATVE